MPIVSHAGHRHHSHILGWYGIASAYIFGNSLLFLFFGFAYLLLSVGVSWTRRKLVFTLQLHSAFRSICHLYHVGCWTLSCFDKVSYSIQHLDCSVSAQDMCTCNLAETNCNTDSCLQQQCNYECII